MNWTVYGTLCYLAVCAAVDIKEKKIPSFLMIAGVLGGLASFIYFWRIHQRQGWELLLIAIPAILFLGLSVWGKCMGIADAAIILVIGLCFGIRKNMFILCLAFLFAAIFSVFLLICKKVSGKSKIPFVPFLFLSSVFVIFIEWESVS